MDRGSFTAPFTILGRPIPAKGEEPQAMMTYASEDVFTALGMPVQVGRAFSERDEANSLPVAMINQAAARQFWPQEDPIGKILRIPNLGNWKESSGMTTGSDLTIVGIVGDARLTSLASDPEPEIYIPHAQTPARWASLMVRTAADPMAMASAVKQHIWDRDTALPVLRMRTLGNIVTESVWQIRFTMALLTVFAGVALLLGAAGIFAVLSYSVTQRRHEIGIRMAMGAERPDVLKMIVVHGVKLACIGIAIGVPAAIALTRSLSNWLQGLGGEASGVQSWGPASQGGFLYGVGMYDPVTFISISVVLLLVAAAACVVPAVRASNLNPLVALRLD
jgi:putative ABC transport system permease protein